MTKTATKTFDFNLSLSLTLLFSLSQRLWTTCLRCSLGRQVFNSLSFFCASTSLTYTDNCRHTALTCLIILMCRARHSLCISLLTAARLSHSCHASISERQGASLAAIHGNVVVVVVVARLSLWKERVCVSERRKESRCAKGQ